jgi:hypothetical protein
MASRTNDPPRPEPKTRHLVCQRLWPKRPPKQSRASSGEYAQRASLRRGKPYLAKAYATAADSLATLSQPLNRIIAAGTLTEIPRIGDAIADIVTKLIRRDRIRALKNCARKCQEESSNYSLFRGSGPTRSSSSIRSSECAAVAARS